MNFHQSERGPAHHVVAGVVRDWIHETPLSLCGRWSDECPDWPKAYELADLIVDALSRTERADG